MVNVMRLDIFYFLYVKVLIFIFSLAEVDFVTADKIFANDKCCWRGPDTGAVPARHLLSHSQNENCFKARRFDLCIRNVFF